MNRFLTRLFLGRGHRRMGEGNVNHTDLVEIYRKAFGMSTWDFLIALIRGVFRFENEWYKELDEELVLMVLDADMGDREEYELDFYDCGAFTFNLMGVFHQNRETAAMPINITWVGWTTDLGATALHAVITFVWQGEVWVIEPQNDNVYPVPSHWWLELACG